jgi:hypothetical protein
MNKLREPLERMVEERPCPTCGGTCLLARDQDGGLVFVGVGARIEQARLHRLCHELIRERDDARLRLAEAHEQVVRAAEKGAEVGWQAGFEFARRHFSLKGRLIGLLLSALNPTYRQMQERGRKRGR